MKKIAISSLPLFIVLAGCSSSATDCGSSEAKELVTQIATSNAPNKLTQFILGNSDLSKKIGDAFNQYQVGRPVDGTIAPELEALTRQADEDAKATTYSVSEIVTKEVDSQTKNVSCEAKLTGENPLGSAELQISYIVEATSDGPVKVTVFGLK